MLVSLVMSKLDDETITRISRRLDVHTIPTWKELRDELDRLSSSLYYEPRKSAASRPDRASTSSKRPIRAAFVATVDTVSTSQTPTPQTQRTRYSSVDHQPGTRRCYACDKPGHTGPLCPELQVRSECERINYVMSKGKCVNCLSSQHPASQCPSNKRCQVCRQKHHTLLHVKSSEAAK